MPGASALIDGLRRRGPELLLLALGIALRASMLYGSDVRWGYDFPDHWKYIEWFARHAGLPSLEVSREAYHPPLYYALAGLVVRQGGTREGLAVVSFLLGAFRLGLIYVGLELYLPESRTGRRVALALAAILPAAVHLDGMVTNEVLFAVLAAGAQLLMPPALRGPARRRWGLAAGLGLMLGLALLTKVSALALIGAFGVAALLELAWNRTGGCWRAEMKRLAPFLLGLLVLGATSGWYFARNERLYAKPFLTSSDGLERWAAARHDGVPYLGRRPLSFLLGWDWAIYAMPYFPSGLYVAPRSASYRGYDAYARPRFFPVLVATTFVDYYVYFYAPPPMRPPWVETGRGRVGAAAFLYSRLSMLGGTIIALATALAWIGAAGLLWRRRDVSRLALLLVPLIALLGQLHFAMAFPVDYLGPIKATYLQFAAGPLYALFGLAVAWLWERPRSRPLAVIAVLALGLVASYSLYCRSAAVLAAAHVL